MSWADELRRAFGQLQAGGHPQVGFIDRTDAVGELGREFNAFSAALGGEGSNGWTREQAHRLRNQLAGILAAVHVLKVSTELPEADAAALEQVRQHAQQLDARLRAR